LISEVYHLRKASNRPLELELGAVIQASSETLTHRKAKLRTFVQRANFLAIEGEDEFEDEDDF